MTLRALLRSLAPWAVLGLTASASAQLTTTQNAANVVFIAGAEGPSIAPVTVSGGTAPYDFSVAPAVPTGLVFDPANGAITGAPAISNLTPAFAGYDDFNAGTDTKWAYFFRLGGTTVTNGTIAFANSRLEFTKGTGAGNYFLGWDGDPATGASRTTASTAKSWTADLVVAHTFNAEVGKFAALGFEIAGGAGKYCSLVVTNAGGNRIVRAAGFGATEVTAPASASSTVWLRLDWDAGAGQLRTSYSLDGTAYTLLKTFAVATEWAGLPAEGFYFEVLGESDADAAIPSGSMRADNFSLRASAPTTHRVTVTDGAGASATNTFVATVNAPALSATAAMAAHSVPARYPVVGFAPVTATGGLPPLTFSVNPALVDGLSMNASTGVVSGTPTDAAAIPLFVGADDFASGLDAKWAYFFRTLGSAAGNGLLTFSQPNGRLDFSKGAGDGSYFLGWDGNPLTSSSRTSASLATSWVADVTVTNSATVAAGRFANIGLEVAGSNAEWAGIMLFNNGGSLVVRGHSSKTTAVDVPAPSGVNVRFRLAWNATTQELAASYSFDGSTYTPLTTFAPVSSWTANAASAGFYFEVFANSNVAEAIAAGSIYADDFAVTATSPAATIFTVRATDRVGATASQDFKLTVNTPPPAPVIAGVTPAAAAPGSTITIAGTDLAGPTAVTVGGATATFTYNSGTGTISATVPATARTGSVVVTTPSGTSGGSAITVPLAINSQPQHSVVTPGQATSLGVTAAGGAPGTYGYQWRKNGTSIAGATGQLYYVGSMAEANVGDYDVVVTAGTESVTSGAAALRLASSNRWQWRNRLPAGNDLSTVAFGAGRYVAVGWSGTILTSANGTDWVPQPQRPPAALLNVVYANGTFVVAGTNGNVLTSADGLTWAQANVGENVTLWGLAYGHGRWVATGSPGALFTSTDGLAWTRQPSPVGASVNGVTATPTGFLAVSSNGHILTTNTDAVSWTSAQPSSTAGSALFDVKLRDGVYVAAGSRKVFASPDAGTWTAVTLPTTDAGIDWNEIVTTTEGFTVVGASYPNTSSTPKAYAIFSADGTTWALRNVPVSPGLIGVTATAGAYTAVGVHGQITRSTDGVNWTSVSTGVAFPGDIYGGASGPAGTLFVGNNGRVLRSANHVDGWALANSGTTQHLMATAYGAGNYVVVGGNGVLATAPGSGIILNSATGETFTAGPTASAPFNAVAYDAVVGRFVAAGEGENILHTANPAGTWASVPKPTSSTIRAAAADGGMYALVGDNGAILISYDGASWMTATPAPTAISLTAVAIGNGRIVAAGFNSSATASRTVIVTSNNGGYTWDVVPVPFTGSARGLIFADGKFRIVGGTSTILTSPDGLGWSADTSQFSGLFRAIVRTSAGYAAGGSGGAIATLAAPITRVDFPHETVIAGTAITPFTPIVPLGGAAPYTLSVAPVLPAGLSFDPVSGAIAGTPANSALVPGFAGSDDFSAAPGARWPYYFRTNGESAVNGMLTHANSRLEFSKGANPGSYFRVWDGDPASDAAHTSASLATSWVADLAVTHTYVAAPNEFASIGLEVGVGPGRYVALMLSNFAGTLNVRSETSPTAASSAAITANTDVKLRLAWNAATRTLTTAYRLPADTGYTTLATYDITSIWPAGAADYGFRFDIFGNSNAAAVIAAGSMSADNFSVSATSPATAIHVVTATDAAGVSGHGFFKLTVDQAAPAIASVTPTSATAGSTVTITGTNLGGATAVKFNGVDAVFSIVSATQLTAVVPATATSGPLTVAFGAGTTLTAATSFTAIAPLVIRDQPAPQRAVAGGPVVFRVGATGPGTLSYQWRKNGADIAGATAAEYRVSALTSAHAGTYSVRVSNSDGGVVSADAPLTVLGADPVLWQQFTEYSTELSPARTVHDGSGKVYVPWSIHDRNPDMVGGRLVGALARLNEADGTLDAAFKLPLRFRRAAYVAIQGDGKLIIAVAAADMQTVIRTDATGALDATFNAPRFARGIRFIALQPDGKVLVAATDNLDAIAPAGALGAAGPALFRLNADGTADPAFTPAALSAGANLFGPPVVDTSGRIYLAGAFSSVNGETRTNIARLAADGSVDLAYAVPSAMPAGWAAVGANSGLTQARGVALQSDGRAVFVGDFLYTGRGTDADRIMAVRFNGDGTLDTTFGMPLRSQLGIGAGRRLRYLLLNADNSIVAVSDRLVRLSAGGVPDSGFVVRGFERESFWVSKGADGRFYVPDQSGVMGHTVMLSTAGRGIARFAADGHPDLAFAVGGWGRMAYPTDGVVLADGRVWVAGSFNRYDGVAVAGLAQFGTDGNLTPTQVAVTRSMAFATIAPAAGDAIFAVLTRPTNSTESTTTSLVRVQSTGALDASFTPALPSGYALNSAALHGVPGGRLLLGQLSIDAQAALNGATGDSLLRLNADGSRDTAYQPGLSSFAVVERNAGNQVTMIRTGGLNVAHVRPDGGALLIISAVDGNLRLVRLGANGAVDAGFTAPSFGTITPSVGFTAANVSDPVSGVTGQFNLSTYSASDLVRTAVQAPDGKVYVGGRFVLDGSPRGLVRLNGDGSLDPTFAGAGIGSAFADAAPYVDALAVDSIGRVYVAGRFDQFNGRAVPGIFRLRTDGALDESWNPGFGVADAPRASVRLVPVGEKLYVVGTVAAAGDPLPTIYRIADIGNPPVITVAPAATTAMGGTPASLHVTVASSLPVTYQWYKGTTAIPGATAATLTFNLPQLADAGGYHVVVGNSAGTIRSAEVQLTVHQPPVITRAPIAQTIVAGQSASFSVEAAAAPAASYQWRRNGLNIGPNSSTLSLANVAYGSGGAITVTISNGLGSVTSDPVALTVNPIAPVITSPTTATAVRGRSFSYQITAATTQATYGASGLPAGLAVDPATGTITGVPTVEGTFTVALTATNVTNSDSRSLTLTVNPPPPIINSPAAAAGRVNAAFTYSIQAVNTPTGYDATGLPAGLTLNTTTGVIAGTPTQHGVFNVTLSATNPGGTTTSPLVLTIEAPLNVPAYTGPLQLSGVQGAAFTFTPAFSNSPTGFTASGRPAGLSVNATTGAITGTLEATGTWTIQIAATNAGGTTTVALTLTVNPAPTAPVITSASTATGTVGSAFSFTLTASGTGSTFTATGLPSTLSLNPTTGVISGTPAAPGTYTVQVRATNGVGTGPQSVLILAVKPAADAPIITSSPVVQGRVGDAFGCTLSATNSPSSFAITNGTLPAGLTLNTSSGAITGTPTQVGQYRVWFAASNTGQGLALEVLFSIASADTTPVITSNGTAAGQVGQPFSYLITASNSPASFAVASGALPAGLSLGAATGLISGIPGEATSAPVTVMLTASNAAGDTSSPKSLAITIAPAPATPVITSPLTASARVGQAFTYQATASENATSFVAQNLPSGLTLNATTGALTGTPTQAGSFSIALRASNAAGLGAPSTLVVSIGSAASAPSITSPAATSGKVGAATAFSYAITATPAPILSYGLSGTLPLGLVFNTSTGVISGRPAEPGIFTVELTATGEGGTSLPQPLVLNIAPADNVPVITSPLYAVATVGQAFTYQITAASTPAFPTAPFPAPYLLDAVHLPAGLAVNPSTGVIQGVPATAGMFTAALVGTNDAGTGPSRDLVIMVQPAATAPVVTSLPSASAQVGSPFGYQITATNTPLGYEVLGAPSWMTVNSQSGALAGTPATPGTFSVQLLATNAAGVSNPLTLNVTVAPAPNTPVIISSRTASGRIGTAFSYPIAATNTATEYIATGLPAGLTLNGATGAIAGTPSASGQFEVTLIARNANGASQPVTLILSIQPNVTLVIPGT